MIMNFLIYPERVRCRLVSKYFMSAASYVFKEVHFSSRERVKFFSEAIKKNPCIALHVQVIKVDNAALLRAINQTDIKRACVNVKEIEILNTQGKGTWAQHLLPYKHVQHCPVLLDAANAKIVTANYAHQLLTLRLGGKYLIEMTIDEICQKIDRVRKVRTVGLHYEFKEKHRELERDLPHSINFKDLNTILKQAPGLTRFELKNCEVADFSMISHRRHYSPELLQHVRTLSTAQKSFDLFDPLFTLTQLDLNNVKVTHVTPFVQSILKGFPNLDSLDIHFAPRDHMLESGTGIRWDNGSSIDWEGFLLPPSKLKKLALAQTEGRLDLNAMLHVLKESQARLEDISLTKVWPGTMLDEISDLFADSLEHLSLDTLKNSSLAAVRTLPHLKTATFIWMQVDRITPFYPIEILQRLPKLTNATLGFTVDHAKVHLLAACQPIHNLTSVTLDRVVMSQVQLKQFFLPLVNLREAIFRFCTFEYLKDRDKDEDLMLSEMFDNRPATGLRMEMVRKRFFDKRKREEAQLAAEDAEKEHEFNVKKLTGGIDEASMPAFYTPRRHNLQMRSLSLEHLGLHDCRLRDVVGGISNARTIRNFEVIQDKRCGIHTCYDVDRAYHEKKNCNPHVEYNEKRVTGDTVTYHFTHEFGGTTGKNNYLVARPTFIISVFSLEKLSIRPNALMSVYFTGVDGNRLKHCDSAVREEVERQAALELTAPRSIYHTVNDASFLNNNDNTLEHINFQPIVNSEVYKEKIDKDVEKVNEVLAKALDEAIQSADTTSSKGFTLDKSIFDSELFEVRSRSSAHQNRIEDNIEIPRRRNKKSLPIRPF